MSAASNVYKRKVLLGPDLAFAQSDSSNSTLSLDLSLAEKVSFYEHSLIEEALELNHGSIKDTMTTLQIARKTLYDKMSKYNLNRDMFTDCLLHTFSSPRDSCSSRMLSSA